MNQIDPSHQFNRRDFLKGGSLSSMAALVGGTLVTAPEKAATQESTKPVSPPVNFGVIGCGYHGRDVIGTLAVLPNAPVVALCDTYGPFLRRAGRSAPKAAKYERYHDLLNDENVEAVIVCTPTHQHGQIVKDALATGKHVYCEAPLSNSLEEAREIALAAKKSPRLYFQAGLQNRADSQRYFLLDFIRTGAWGRTVQARAQWHKKVSWRRTAPTNEREREINWRLDDKLSTGLIGEIGIHQIDAVSWFFKKRPVGVYGFSSTIQWNDGRKVPDTVQAMVEYPKGVQLSYDVTLANSFDADHEIYYGTSAALMVRGSKAWMFKEADAPLLGWEVYALKETFHKEIGIALSADATKLTTVTGNGGSGEKVDKYTNTPLYYALEAFVHNTGVHRSGVEDFVLSFGDDDPEALVEYLADLDESRIPSAGYEIGYEATVTALKINEAVVTGKPVTFEDQWFDLG
ncbi:MAG: Inositol 2-dehydrogenase [Verrucomicrobia subdivision 3 bacterium]|nr:Inositol 2-dehydrogenase [Limisphaerales bacterium]MCS1417556.1 Inositol 2-dehydrogenase [Limisphaerales bacterium]